MTLVTEINFKTGRRYDNKMELLQRLGLEQEIRNSFRVYSAKMEGGANPKIIFTATGGVKRGVFISEKEGQENRYRLHLPNNSTLYNKVYGTLRAKNVKFEPRLVELDSLGLPDEHLDLLRPYE